MMASISTRCNLEERELSVRLVCEEEELSASQVAIYTEWEKKVEEYDELIKKHKEEENKYNKVVKDADTRVGMKEAERLLLGPTEYSRTAPSSISEGATAHPGATRTISLVQLNTGQIVAGVSNHNPQQNAVFSNNQAGIKNMTSVDVTNSLQFRQIFSIQNQIANGGLMRLADNSTSQETRHQKETELDAKALSNYFGYKKGVRIPGEGIRRFMIKCFHCSETMRSNIQYADHVKKIAETQLQQSSNMRAGLVCPHCFKRFRTPAMMTKHLEYFHVKGSFFRCFTCDLSFCSNWMLIKHMSQFHTILQMPFVCQICQYRTSSYTDIMTHFVCKHEGFRALMCPYCLRILRCSKTFLDHCRKHVHLFTQSQMGGYACKRCKLSFLTSAERSEHAKRDHKRLNIRDGVPLDVQNMLKSFQAMKTADVSSQPRGERDPPQVVGKHNDFKNVYIAMPLPKKEMLCMECGQKFSEVGMHFSRILHCELCSYTTQCSQSFTNHMILFHKDGRKPPKVGVVSKKMNSDGTVLLTCKACFYQTRSPIHMAHHRGKKCKHRTQLEWMAYLFVPTFRRNSRVNEVVVLDSDDDC